ncbi:hypothetical protein LZF96_02445 [Streptomyces sp. ST2-7A]|nr:hypothetical protein [Streptomyces sp. ST2-7A]
MSRRWMVVNAGVAVVFVCGPIVTVTARGEFSPVGGALLLLFSLAVGTGTLLLLNRLATAWRRGEPGPNRPTGGREPEWRPTGGGPGPGGDRAPM